jgi:hypothetical protein
VPLVQVAQVDDEGAHRQQVGQRGRLCQRHVVGGSTVSATDASARTAPAAAAAAGGVYSLRMSNCLRQFTPEKLDKFG